MARKKKNAGVVPLTSPQTREEHYLANIAGLVGTKPEYSFTRVERYLDAISGSTSGLDDRVTALEIGKLDVIGKGVNLLDNAYFIGGGTAGKFPINQRGQTGASAYPNYGGTIDRWSSNGGTVGVLSDGIALSGFIGGQLYQTIENYAAYKGKELTVSALGSSSDGNSYHISVYDGISYSTGNMYFPASKGLASATFAVSPNATTLVVQIINSVSGATASLEAVKLELGTQQTLARQVNGSWVLNDAPPDYGEELAKCQRYLQVFEGDAYAYLGTTYDVSSTSIEPILPLLVPMSKKTGSILASTTALLQTNGAWNQQVTIPAGSNNVRISSNTAAFTISLANGLLGTFPSMGAISSDGNTKIIISTE